MPAPKNNLNSLKTGHSQRRRGLPSCRLPKRYRFADQRVDSWRCRLEEALQAVGVKITLPIEALIAEACDCERSRQFLSGRLRDAGEQTLSVELELIKSIRDLARQRNAIITKLFPESAVIPDPESAWEAFDRAVQHPSATQGPEPSPTPQNATDATSEPHSVPGSGPGEWRAD